MAKTRTHSELREELIDKAIVDVDFRSQLMDDPKSAIKDALGIDLPDAFAVDVHEDTETRVHLVLPPSSDLNEGDLEATGGHVKPGTTVYSGGQEGPR